jgi:integrase
MELLLLTFVRKMELLGARWEELDLEAAEWRLPAHRMKMREPHVVPLSTQAVALFKQAKQHASGSEFVFPSLSSLKKPLSETALNNALKRLGYGHFSPHAFRRTASTMLNERGYRSDVIERQLAHMERNRIRAAYNKATYLAERTKMMQDWANYVVALVEGSNVVAIGSRRDAS